MQRLDLLHSKPTTWLSQICYGQKWGGTFNDQNIGQQISRAIELVNAHKVWQKGYRGRGVKVLVLDTGIDKDHPALVNQVQAMRDFIYDGNQPYSVFDRNGHGTHVAGIIAGGTDGPRAVGVAPEARLLIGRVCASDGCSVVRLIEAIEWGIEEGVDVINMSYGTPSSSLSEELALREAYLRGITLVALTGNDGDGQVHYPGAYREVIAVGAVDERLERASFSNFGAELDLVAPGVHIWSAVPVGTGRDAQVELVTCAMDPFKKVTLLTASSCERKKLMASTFVGVPLLNDPIEGEVVFAGLGRSWDFASLNVQGKIVVVDRGEIFFYEKAENAASRGAVGLVVINSSDDLFGGALYRDGQVATIPVVLIGQSDGARLKKQLTSGFSLRITLNILPGHYAGMSGTSMATPVVTGVIALLKGAKPSLSPLEIKEVLKKTARPLPTSLEDELGAGLVDAWAALRAILPE